jgi:hypothetical protein
MYPANASDKNGAMKAKNNIPKVFLSATNRM